MNNNQNHIQSPGVRFQKPGLLEVGDLFGRTWQVFKSRFWVFVGIMAIPAVIPLLYIPFGALWVVLRFTFSPLIFFSTVIVLAITVFFVSSWAYISLLYAVKDREQKIGFRESFAKGWHKLISYWWVAFLTSLITLGGFILFLVPGIIFFIWFSMALYVLVAEDQRGMRVLFRSKQLVQGYWWGVFWRLLLVGLLMGAISLIASFIPIIGGLSALFTTPFSVTFGFLLYEDLKKLKAGAAFEPPEKGTKVKFILAAVAGLLLIPAILYGIFFMSTSGAKEKARDVRRKVDMRQIVTAQEMYWASNDHYYQSISYPSSIPGFMTETPSDPATNGPYGWVDNTGDGQKFCAYADLKEGGFYIASHSGTGEVDAKPIFLSDCEEFSQKLIYPLKEEEGGLNADQLMEDAQLKIQEVMAEKTKTDSDYIKVQSLVAEAISKAAKATELEPENPETWFQRGNIYYQIMDLAVGADEWALKSYQRALELHPGNQLYQQKVNQLSGQETTKNCTDSDGGKDYYVKGETHGLSDESSSGGGWIWGEDPDKSSARYDSNLDYTIFYDHCFDSEISNQLNEGFCDSQGYYSSVGYQCSYGCKDGACLVQ